MTDMMWAIPLTIGVYLLFLTLNRKFKLALINPLLLSTVVIIAFLMITKIEYETYNKGTEFITFLIGPATVSLALPLYEKLDILKKHYKITLVTIVAGVIVHALSIGVIAVMLKTTDVLLASFIPKSVTTAIAVGISESLGGIKYLTVVVVIITGVLGATIAPYIFRLFKIDHPVARGLSLGAGAHVIGTTKAIEYGELEASMSTLSLIITGLITVISSPFIYEAILFFL